MKFLNSALVTLIAFAFADAETASRGRDAQSTPRGRVLPGYGDGGYGGKKGGYGSESGDGYGGKKGGYGSESDSGDGYGGKKAGYDADGADYGGKKAGYDADGVDYGGKKAGYDFDGYGGKKAGYDADGYAGKKGCGKGKGGKGGKGKGGGYDADGYGGKKAGYDFDGYGGKKAGYDFDGYGGKKEGKGGKGTCGPSECIKAEYMCVDGAPTVKVDYSYTDDCNTPDADPHGCAPMPSDFVGLYPCEEEADGFKNEPATWVYTCYDRNCRRDDVDSATSEGSFTMADDTLPEFSTQGRHMSLEKITETQPGCYIAALNRLDGFSPPPYYNICLSEEIEITPC